MPNNFPPSVHWHPDGDIYVRAGERFWSGTPEEFKTDFGFSYPTLPPGVIEQIYEPNKRHAFHGPDGVIGGGEQPWQFGDECLHKLNTALASKQTRDAAKEAARQETFQKEAEARSAAAAAAAEEQNKALRAQSAEITAQAEKKLTEKIREIVREELAKMK